MALKHHPDAILMDIEMPIMDGHQAVSNIRRDPWGKHATIVFLTNLSDAGNIVQAVEHESEEYLVKANMTPTDVVGHVLGIIGKA